MRERKTPEQIEATAKAKFLTMTDRERVALAARLTAGIKQPQMRAALVKMTIRDKCLLALSSIERTGYIATI